MLQKVVVLAVILMCMASMWFAFDLTSLAGSPDTLKSLESQLNSLRFGYVVGIVFGVIAGVVLMLVFKRERA
jgi:hypothetical protein